MQRLYMPRSDQDEVQRVKNLAPTDLVRETKLRFDAKLCEDGYAKRMTAKYARVQALSCFSKGLQKCSRLNASLPPADCAKFEHEYCVCEASCASAVTPASSPKSPPTVASPLLFQKEDFSQPAIDRTEAPVFNELAEIVEGERRQTREEKDQVVQRCCKASSDARQRLIASRRNCSSAQTSIFTMQNNNQMQNQDQEQNREITDKKQVKEHSLKAEGTDQLMKDLEHTQDQTGLPHCTTPPPQLALRRHVSCLKSNKKTSCLRKRVSFSTDTKCHDGLAMEQHCLDLLIWNYFVRNTVSNFDDVTALVANAANTHLDTDSASGRALATQSSLQKLALMLADLKHRVNISCNGIAPVLPGGGGFGAKLEVRHLGDVDELREMVSKAKDMALAAARGHTKPGCLNAINLQKDSLGSPRSRNSMMITGMVAENAGQCSPEQVNSTPLSSC